MEEEPYSLRKYSKCLNNERKDQLNGLVWSYKNVFKGAFCTVEKSNGGDWEKVWVVGSCAIPNKLDRLRIQRKWDQGKIPSSKTRLQE